MNLTSYKPATEDPECAAFLLENRDNILSFAMETLQKPHIRADYKHLIELVIIFMGENPFHPETIRFRPPIAVSSARFMARIIYCLMIHMFALTGRRIPYASAPRTDLQLAKDLASYKECAEVSKITSSVFKNHLWYLHSTTVGLAFFDEEISVEEK
ncbi:Holliday junction ATP-dependent DNA helicase RuvB [Frankliniella fusca]|uniref:Holliday junction ATP-dependent DNA helicase RuvB n=1 Tax=Frankliniella fusca TaxID=407009 RepID=A0AAE1HKI9_9NEOP|nr:Holliday junction ATP-dependent DNA helicase RuvB [Frankliniella fusca]